MKEKTKQFLKKYLIGFILGVVSAGVVIVYAETYFPSNDVTYDNTESGLTSTNVQGAIDELYGVCFPPKVDFGDIEVPVVDDEDGLYEDEYEDGRYFYKGADPNNYITFNNEEAGWRIISIEPNKTIKIMRIESLGNQYWAGSGNNWENASLNTYLNSTYYNGLNSTAKSQIVTSNFSIGAVKFGNSNLAEQINDENEAKWNGKVALVTASEYIRSNSNKSSCGSFSLNNENYSTCINTGWMNTTSISRWWTLSLRVDYDTTPLVLSSEGYFYGDFSGQYFNLAVRPTLYLSKDIKITGGTGTESDPYTIN